MIEEDFESPASGEEEVPSIEGEESEDLPIAVAAPTPETARRLGGGAPWVDVPVPEGVDPETYVPTEYIGNPIAPNKLCRAWNPKPSRNKYCRAPAGMGTEHPGVGRCKHHGGATPLQGDGSRIRRYKNLYHRTVADILKVVQEDPDPMGILPELDLARALVIDFVNRHAEFAEALLDWHASYKLQKRPLSKEDADAYIRVVTEYAIFLKEGGQYTDLQITDCTRAERFIEAMQKPVEQGRPRKVVDIIEVRGLLEVIVKLVGKLDERSTITEAEMNRIIASMSRVVDVIIPNKIPKKADGAEYKRLIREGWMRVVTR